MVNEVLSPKQSQNFLSQKLNPSGRIKVLGEMSTLIDERSEKTQSIKPNTYINQN